MLHAMITRNNPRETQSRIGISFIIYSMFLFCCLNSLSIPPGTKLSLTGTITVKESFLMLDSNNTKVLGGEVEKLKEKWELNKVIIKFTF